MKHTLKLLTALLLPRRFTGRCRIALEFFRTEKIPFAEMTNANALVGNTKDDNSKFCFAKPGELYTLTAPDHEDWLAVLRRAPATPAR